MIGIIDERYSVGHTVLQITSIKGKTGITCQQNLKLTLAVGKCTRTDCKINVRAMRVAHKHYIHTATTHTHPHAPQSARACRHHLHVHTMYSFTKRSATKTSYVVIRTSRKRYVYQLEHNIKPTCLKLIITSIPITRQYMLSIKVCTLVSDLCYSI